jgi:glycosyltransferase involved in cell wall biosynthesis
MKHTKYITFFIKNLIDYLVISRSGLFDKDYYRQEYLADQSKMQDPLWHFIRIGCSKGNNPSEEFDTNYYVNAYPDVAQSNLNPLRHYITFGRSERRSIRPPLTMIKKSEFIQALKPVENGTIFITHETSRTGAPINLLHLVKTYQTSIGDNYVILSMAEGNYLEAFKQLGNFLSFSKTISFYPDEITHELFLELNKLGYTKCIANTIFTGVFVYLLKQVKINPVFIINELPETIQALNCSIIARYLSNAKVNLVFPCQMIADQFSSHFGLSHGCAHIVPQSVRPTMRYDGKKIEAKKALLTKLNINELNDTKIVLGVGTAQYLKGIDLFVDVAKKLHHLKRLDSIHFLWLGDLDSNYKKWMQKKYHKLAYRSHLHFLHFEDDPAYIFAASDIYLLTSRQDTYPSTALEALANQTPVIMFSGTGGIEEILDGHNGIAVPHLDTLAMANAVLKWLDSNLQISHDDNNFYTYQDYLQKLLLILND